MVNELRELLRESASEAPYDDGDLADVLRAGRRRSRIRRAGAVAGASVAVAALSLVAATVVGTGDGDGHDPDAVERPLPAGDVLRLSDATRAAEGTDYTALASTTSPDLDRANGQYFDGMTDDGLVLFRDGPRGVDNVLRYALLDPATGDKEWLPDSPATGQAWPISLGAERLLLVGFTGSAETERPVVYAFDRGSREWSTITWGDLPASSWRQLPVVGPDGRLYLAVVARLAGPPEGGWPVGPDGEAEDADAAGDTYRLWSASLSDPTDVREEGITLGSFAFAGDSLVYSDSTNGEAGRIHVRDLATGEESSFDPQAGERCNLLSFAASGDRIVMGEYCGTYGDVRDDRVQILSTDGDLVATLQDDSIEGTLGSASADGGLVQVTSYSRAAPGTYVYDLATDRFVRVSEGFSRFGSGAGPVPAGHLLWSTPVNRGHGQTQVLVEWRG